MENNTYIIKFPDQKSRDNFRDRFLQEKDLNKSIELHFAKVLPDVIVSNVSPDLLERLRSIAGSEAEFFEDFQYGLAL